MQKSPVFPYHSIAWALLPAAMVICGTSLWAVEVENVGAGSYAIRPPAGAKTPPPMIYRTKAVHGPMPTNEWWSSLAWDPLSEAMYPHPLAVRAVTKGLRVYYPGENITADSTGILASMPDTGMEDFVIGNSAAEGFQEARVDGFSDWFVSTLFEREGIKLRTTFGHGSPYVFVEIAGGNPTLTFAAVPRVWSGGEKDPVLGISVGNRHYGVFAPTGSTWSNLGAKQWTAKTNGKNYFSVAVLPDASPQTLEAFRRYAHHHVTDTRVAWQYDEPSATVRTTFTFTTQAREGSGEGTIFALYPHQWTRTQASLDRGHYRSVRGPMKIGMGTTFTTEVKYPGVLPVLPLVPGEDAAELDGYINHAVEVDGAMPADDYWLGKRLGKWATLLALAEQTGNRTALNVLTRRTKDVLENFFTATDSGGKLKKIEAGLLFHDANWGTLIGYPASYGSDTELNDHHFHYGYFIHAAGELARRDPAWASDARWGAMVKLLIRDIASVDRADPKFPFLRCFDPYAGHSWASGHGRFADGNNQESSSEAMNAWYGLILFGEATGDRALRNLGVWLFSTELSAIEDYWFDVSDRFHPKEYTPPAVPMIWGGKGVNATWFSKKPEHIHGINWLPITGASLYLGRYPGYVRKNYAALAATAGPRWEDWGDLVWMYLALADSRAALAQFDARAPELQPEAGNSLANVFHWIKVLDALGTPDRTVTADSPFYAAFVHGKRKTYVAYNTGDAPRVVRFTDGVTLQCPPKRFGIATQ